VLGSSDGDDLNVSSDGDDLNVSSDGDDLNVSSLPRRNSSSSSKRGLMWFTMIHTNPSPNIVRLSIPIPAHTYDVFKRISAASGVPLGRCMAQWLGDTLDAAEYMAGKLEEVRARPGDLSRELTGFAVALSAASDDVILKAKSQIPPPSSNTGGKLPRSARK